MCQPVKLQHSQSAGKKQSEEIQLVFLRTSNLKVVTLNTESLCCFCLAVLAIMASWRFIYQRAFQSKPRLSPLQDETIHAELSFRYAYCRRY
jgi:hypothetical protein